MSSKLFREIPKGWVQAALPEVAELNPPNPELVPHDDQLVSFVPMSAVSEMTGRLDPSQQRPWNRVKKGYTKFQNGDVLFAKITPCMENGKVTVAGGLYNGIGAGSTEFHVLRPTGALKAKFLAYYLLREDFRRDAKGKMSGTAGQLRVPAAFMESQQLAVPPIQEQGRIVDAIAAYLTKLDAAVAAFERLQGNLKRYRASVLKAAVEGRLVPTEAEIARGEDRDYEPASVLLQRILSERRRRWEEAELARMKPRGKRPKPDQWKATYKEPAGPETTGLPKLPEGWCWTAMLQLGELGRGKSKHRPRDDPRLLGGPYPFIQTGDIRKADSFIESFEQTYSEFGLQQSRLWPARTLCITIAANIAETGILKFAACFPDSVVGFLHNYDPVVVRFVEFFIRTAREHLERYAPATAQKNINLQTLYALAVPFPPLAEQFRIVAEVDRLLSLATESGKVVARSIDRCHRLRQSILKSAFEGKLVDQDPSDEPASLLLERIRAEREVMKAIQKSSQPSTRRNRTI